MATVLILGAGVMGSAFTLPLADSGHDVRLVGTPIDTARRATSPSTATVAMPSSLQARWMRSAISPRFAIRTLSNIVRLWRSGL